MSEQQVLRICTDVVDFVGSSLLLKVCESCSITEQMGEESKKRRSRFKIGEHEDSEIQAEINKGNIVSIMQDY